MDWIFGNKGKIDPKSMSEAERTKYVIDELEEFANLNPPTIGVIGTSGVGKSSTLNAMFGTNFVVSGNIRGTTEINSKKVELMAKRGPAKDKKITLRVVDAPGLGEDVRKDEEYLSMYSNALPECDVVIWVMTARNRAIALDQTYLKRLDRFWPKLSSVSIKVTWSIHLIGTKAPICHRLSRRTTSKQ